jgi:hypothetical protein
MIEMAFAVISKCTLRADRDGLERAAFGRDVDLGVLF